MEGLRIVGLCIVASIVYGIVHDLFSVNVCVEYLGVHHPPIGTQNPLLLALGWGVLATWWYGLTAGCVIAAAARIGAAPKLGWRELVKPVAFVLSAVLVFAFTVWGLVYMTTGTVMLAATDVPNRRLGATAVMHGFSYGATAVSALGIAAWEVRARLRRSGSPPASASAP